MPIQTAIDSISNSQGSPFGFKNRIINGGMVIDQRNAGVSGTSNAYTVDRWAYYGSQSAKGTWQQNAGSVTPPDGFKNYLGFTSSSAYSVGSSDIFMFWQSIEGYNIADLNWGTSNAKPVTLSFWVRSSLGPGTFGGALQGGGGSWSYPFTYTISSPNTWEQKTITISGATSGTWNSTTSSGMIVRFALGVGSTYSGTAGAWANSDLYSATGAVSVVGTNAATFYVTGVQLERGTQATSFDYRPYGTEMQLCRRYFYQSPYYANSGLTYAAADFLVYGAQCGAGVWMFAHSRLPVEMRIAPTLTTSDTAGTTGKCTIFTSSGGSQTSGITPYTVYVTKESFSVSVYNESKNGIFGAIRADAEY
jgi:hypothetical protein